MRLNARLCMFFSRSGGEKYSSALKFSYPCVKKHAVNCFAVVGTGCMCTLKKNVRFFQLIKDVLECELNGESSNANQCVYLVVVELDEICNIVLIVGEEVNVVFGDFYFFDAILNSDVVKPYFCKICFDACYSALSCFDLHCTIIWQRRHASYFFKCAERDSIQNWLNFIYFKVYFLDDFCCDTFSANFTEYRVNSDSCALCLRSRGTQSRSSTCCCQLCRNFAFFGDDCALSRTRTSINCGAPQCDDNRAACSDRSRDIPEIFCRACRMSGDFPDGCKNEEANSDKQPDERQFRVVPCSLHASPIFNFGRIVARGPVSIRRRAGA